MIFPGVKRTKILCRRKLMGKSGGGGGPQGPKFGKTWLKNSLWKGELSMLFQPGVGRRA